MIVQNYRKKLKDELIEYRYNLDLPKELTFGIEIEYENIVNDTMSHLLDFESLFNSNLKKWENKREADINVRNKLDELMNGEVVSPILTDKISDWKNLKLVLNILKRNDAIITEKCGGHVNIGAHILGSNVKYWRNFLLLWILYEKEIYKFSSGEYSYVRKRNDNTINRIGIILNQKIKEILIGDDEIYTYLRRIANFSKLHDLSLERFISPNFEENNRIEFRVPNGSLSEEIWQNYINFFAKLLLTCKKELDIDKLVYKINNNEHNVVELADLIFKDQIDKDNFLIQTLKTNKIYKKELPKHIIY